MLKRNHASKCMCPAVLVSRAYRSSLESSDDTPLLPDGLRWIQSVQLFASADQIWPRFNWFHLALLQWITTHDTLPKDMAEKPLALPPLLWSAVAVCVWGKYLLGECKTKINWQHRSGPVVFNDAHLVYHALEPKQISWISHLWLKGE